MILRTETRGRLRVEFTDDQATPVMVYSGPHSCTFECALYVGTMGDSDEIVINDSEMAWLENLEEEATTHYDTYRDPSI
jgi:hypothetical protein